MKYVVYCGNLCTGIEDRDLGVLISKLKGYARRAGMEGELEYRWFQSDRDLIKVKISSKTPTHLSSYKEIEFNCHEVEEDSKVADKVMFVIKLVGVLTLLSLAVIEIICGV